MYASAGIFTEHLVVRRLSLYHDLILPVILLQAVIEGAHEKALISL